MTMPLAMAEQGKTVEIKEILCGMGLRRRLADIGIYEGAKIKIVKNDIVGPILVRPLASEFMSSKFMLGRGEAQKIMVE